MQDLLPFGSEAGLFEAGRKRPSWTAVESDADGHWWEQQREFCLELLFVKYQEGLEMCKTRVKPTQILLIL